jgi:hypothetical protein
MRKHELVEALRRIRDNTTTIGEAHVEADAALRAYQYGRGKDPNSALYANPPYSRFAEPAEREVAERTCSCGRSPDPDVYRKIVEEVLGGGREPVPPTTPDRSS